MQTRLERMAAKQAAKIRRREMLAANLAILTTGVCPTCGTKLYRNLALSGWWQCGHFGAVGFQREAGPNCNFQFFYDPTPEEHEAILALTGKFSVRCGRE